VCRVVRSSTALLRLVVFCATCGVLFIPRSFSDEFLRVVVLAPPNVTRFPGEIASTMSNAASLRSATRLG